MQEVRFLLELEYSFKLNFLETLVPKPFLRQILPPDLLEEFKDALDLEETFVKKIEEHWKLLGKTPEEYEKSLSPEERQAFEAKKDQAELKLMKKVRQETKKQKSQTPVKSQIKKIARGNKKGWIQVR